jgi:hypothetical protein
MPGGVLVELAHTLGGAYCETTVTLLKHQVVTVPTLESAQLAVFLWWRDDMLPLLSRELVWFGMQVKSLETEDGPLIWVPFDEPFNGGRITGAPPVSVSARLNLQVSAPPGGLKGCMFLPGIPQDQVNQNTLSNQWRADVFEGANRLIDAAPIQGWRWVVSSRQHNRVDRPSRVSWRVVTASITSPYVAQRRKRSHNQVLPR